MKPSPASVESPSYYACFRSFRRTGTGISEWNATFINAHELLAGTSEDAGRILNHAERASRNGYWVVLALTYEASPAFDHHYQVHPPPGDKNVIQAAVFKPEEVDTRVQPIPDPGRYRIGPWHPAISRGNYNRAIRTIKNHIKAGDTYQVNYTFPLHSHFSGNVATWFHDLGEAQQAEYCALLNLPQQLILSLSPELFFRCKGNIVYTCPMKGTIARGRFPEEDLQRRQALSECPKNRAENIMITDLVRNDLGRIARAGTVTVPRLCRIEKFKTVWQMTSEVRAEVGDQTALGDIFTALFPCGSITGAPKIRTMQIIRELEPYPRHIYTGAIGFLKPGGDGIFNVPIRTVTIDKRTGRSQFGVGGGITSDSTPQGEFDECLLKASFLTTPPIKFSLLETILLDQGSWFLLDYHLDRWQQSAGYFQFLFDRDKIIHELTSLQIHHQQHSWIVRLQLSPEGRLKTETIRLPAKPDNKILRVKLNLSAIDSNDIFLFHKTTHRTVYNQARQSRTDCDETILYNEKGELTEGCIHNLAIEIGGEIWTPPVACGLLAGTFRRYLLETGQIKEKILYPEDLRRADAIRLFNSVRKWRRAELTEE